MKYTYVIFMCMLFLISACETINKKPESDKYEKLQALEYSSWVTYVMIVNLSDSSSKYNKEYFRKALAYSIDKSKLFNRLTLLLDRYPVDSNGVYLGGQGKYGIVPPAFPEYNIGTIRGYSLNEDSATYYFKKSKYKLKNRLEIYEGSNRTGIDYWPTYDISLDWTKYLGLPSVSSNVVTRETRNKQAFLGKEGLYIIPITVGGKPEKYLELFYSKNDSSSLYSNAKQTAYNNSMFDAYYEAGIKASNREEAINNFKAAEQILIDDAVIIPLFYSRFIY